MSVNISNMEPRMVFDGFCYRDFNEETDGYADEMPTAREFPAVEQAQGVMDMFDEIKRLRRENWELKKSLKRLKDSSPFKF